MEEQGLIFCSALIIFFSSLFLISKLHFKSKSSHLKPPSPPSIPIIGHLYLLKKPLHRSLSALSHRYGPILSLLFGFRSVLVISSLALVEECFTKNDIVFSNRPHLLAG
ncbi:hypothetical protein MRB53_017403 [Persea americana]|uniref:Uncharacterized protein n=1 Tax=Persea americana TaxID=3435 RepID=A0ACC2M5W8_PERAE|nr:hypothetical protein MRB53_017403 [Persea americana]